MKKALIEVTILELLYLSRSSHYQPKVKSPYQPKVKPPWKETNKLSSVFYPILNFHNLLSRVFFSVQTCHILSDDLSPILISTSTSRSPSNPKNHLFTSSHRCIRASPNDVSEPSQSRVSSCPQFTCWRPLIQIYTWWTFWPKSSSSQVSFEIFSLCYPTIVALKNRSYFP